MELRLNPTRRWTQYFKRWSNIQVFFLVKWVGNLNFIRYSKLRISLTFWDLDLNVFMWTQRVSWSTYTLPPWLCQVQKCQVRYGLVSIALLPLILSTFNESVSWKGASKLFSDDLSSVHHNHDHLLVAHGEHLLVAGQAVHILKTTWKADCKFLKSKSNKTQV